MSYQTFKNLIALYFYNNSNNIAVLLSCDNSLTKKSGIFKAFWPFGDHFHSLPKNIT